MAVITGLERFLADPPTWAKAARIGLLANPASVDRRFRHAAIRMHERFGRRLTTLYSPQHGYHAEKQDNMIESDDTRDPVLGVAVVSLYGKTRRPTEAMLAPIDVLVIDLIDVGTRVYTFATTVAYCMAAAADAGKRVVVLDRPNPINGLDVEGPCLDPAFASFVGPHPIAMRHGMTMAELARLFNAMAERPCDLEVVPMHGWDRGMFFRDTGLSWVIPSPNLPTPEAALVYPGLVLWDGTNVSEGRGTTLPFEQFGAPFVDGRRMIEAMGGPEPPGAVLRPVAFEPTSNKWAGRRCDGAQIHVTGARDYRPFRTAVRLLEAVMRISGDAFQWKPPPYEYETERLPIDMIFGGPAIRRHLCAGGTAVELEAAWTEEESAFRRRRAPYLLYPEAGWREK